MVQIVINGVFAEDFIETNHRHIFRSFCRTFCIIPFGNGWSIISDMLFVTVVSDELLLVSKLVFFLFYSYLSSAIIFFEFYRNLQNAFIFTKQSQYQKN